MRCKKLSPLCRVQMLLLLLLLSLFISLALLTVGFAADSEPPEKIESDIEQNQEYLPDENSDLESEASIILDYPLDMYSSESLYGDDDSEILLMLKSIEYQLKIIAGGVVLILIGLFIWFTILKPIKQFTSF